jgi:hypothetical protein
VSYTQSGPVEATSPRLKEPRKVNKILSRDNLDIAEISVENYHDVDDFGRTLKSKILADLQEVKNS